MEYQISLPEFEGPFALLFHLIEKAEVDIYDVSIANITAQYLQTLQAMHELNLDIASEFLVMAATLLKLKSKKLLPAMVEVVDELEEDILTIDSQEELLQRLLEYRYFRNVAEELRRFEVAQKRVYIRSLSGERVVLVNPEEEMTISGVTLPGLMQAFQKLLADRERQPQEISPDDFSVQEKMQKILAVVCGKRDGLDFFALFSERASLSEIIATFVALLELVRLRKIMVWQADSLSQLMIVSKS